MRKVLKKSLDKVTVLFSVISLLYIPINSFASTKALPPFDWDYIWELFEESYLFEEQSQHVWTNIQLVNLTGKRPDKTKTLIPNLSINYERQVFNNFGIRSSLAFGQWRERKVLAESLNQEFFEQFTYRFTTLDLGILYHFNLSEKVDLYAGIGTGAHIISAKCECTKDLNIGFSFNTLIGARYYIDSFFTSMEVGNSGNGLLKLGIGYSF